MKGQSPEVTSAQLEEPEVWMGTQPEQHLPQTPRRAGGLPQALLYTPQQKSHDRSADVNCLPGASPGGCRTQEPRLQSSAHRAGRAGRAWKAWWVWHGMLGGPAGIVGGAGCRVLHGTHSDITVLLFLIPRAVATFSLFLPRTVQHGPEVTSQAQEGGGPRGEGEDSLPVQESHQGPNLF